MRNLFDNQLNTLHRKLIEMGSACETAIDLAVRALLEGNLEIAHEAAAHDREIDQMERSIKAQFKYADKLGVKYVAVIGESELTEGAMNVKNMATGESEKVAFAEAVEYFCGK